MSGTPNRVDVDHANELDALRARVTQLEREEARRRKVERELQESEERYRVLVETMNDGLGVQDERGIVVYVNDKFCRMLGCSRIDLVGRPAIDFVDESHRNLHQQEMTKRVRGDRASYEIVLAARDGRKVFALVSPVPIFGPEGEFKGGFAVFTDITERKKVEETLEHERNLLRTIMDSIPDYAYVKDTEARFVTTNIAHLRVLGVNSLSDVVGKTDFDFFPRELAEQYFANDQEVLRSGQPMLNKVEDVVDRTGRLRWVMTFKAPLRDRTGAVVGLVGVSRDITELRIVAHALRESEDRLRLILENSRDIAYKLNLETGQFEYVSPSVLQASGFSAQELMMMGARGYFRLIHREDRVAVMAYLKNRRSPLLNQADRERSGVSEYRVRHKSGQYRWVAQSATTIWGKGQRPVAEVGTLRDITESKQAEEAVRAASRMEATATLAGGIAHDFNNLMVGVLGNAELLQMRLAHDPEAMRMLATIAKSAQQAGELAQQMLAYARGGKYEPRVMDLNEVIRDTLRLEEHSFPPRIRIERHMDPHLWSIKADPVQIGQVVMNLSINAVEAIPDTGRIRITTRNVDVAEAAASAYPGMVPGRYVCLAVEDTGHGMSTEIIAHVFEPFFTTKFQGRGLGLAAAYGIVKNHGGHILVHSEQGHGSRFEVLLPPVEEKPVPGAKIAAPTAGTETILVIDDEPIVLNVTREILERLGYHVLCAHDGQEAVDIARAYEGEIHLAVLDMGMPTLGGAQAFPLLQATRPKMKVIISSGYELDPAAQALLDAGASAFIHKPFRSRVLASKIRTALTSQ